MRNTDTNLQIKPGYQYKQLLSTKPCDSFGEI